MKPISGTFALLAVVLAANAGFTARLIFTDRSQSINDVLPKLPSWPINNVAVLSPLNWKSSG